MVLNGSNIYLRALEPEDLDYLYTIENNPEVWHLSNTLAPLSRFVLKQYIEQSIESDIYTLKQQRFMICKKNNNSSIGTIDLFDFDPTNHRAGIGILLSEKSNRGLGYGSEALKLLINYSFEILHLHQLYCNILEDNSGSINLFTKFGFSLVGTKIDWIFTKNKYTNELLFQLIKQK